MENGRKARGWFGTSFVVASDQGNGDGWFRTKTKEFGVDILSAGAVWAVYQYEVGESGRKHLQFAVYFKHARSRKSIGELELWPSRPHLETIKGTYGDCAKYCSKEEGRVVAGDEVGERPMQGSRSDLADIYWALREGGEGILAVADRYPGDFMRYGRSFREAQFLYKPRVRKRRGVLFYGETGLGKSRNADAVVRGRSTYDHPGGKGNWWDGYDGEDVVIFDDFDWKETPVREFLKWLDWKPKKVQRKGGFVKINAEWIIFTSNDTMDEWWPEDPAHRDAVARRFDFIICLTEAGPIFDKGSVDEWKEKGFKEINNFN